MTTQLGERRSLGTLGQYRFVYVGDPSQTVYERGQHFAGNMREVLVWPVGKPDDWKLANPGNLVYPVLSDEAGK